jgi:hypothetical protein
MTPPPDPAPDPAPDPDRRNRLVGRLIILGFGVLLAAYLIPLFWDRLFNQG